MVEYILKGGDNMNKLPSFQDFVSQFNFNSFMYDLGKASPDSIKHPSDLFTQEQYEFLMSSCSAMTIAFLRRYHEWLSEQL